MKTIYNLFILCFISVSLYSQSNGEIKGKILDSLTNQPLFLANVWVEIGSSIIGTATDIEGRYTLKPLSAGYYNLNVSYTGKKKYILGGVRVNSSSLVLLKNILLVDNTTIIGAQVIAERFTKEERLIKPDNPTVMTILQSELKTSPFGKMPKELIAKTVPGIVQLDDGQPLYFRGARNDAVQYYVDGVKTRNGTLCLPGCAIGEMNVYTGGVPAMYGDLTGGVVVIESKSFFDIYNQRKGK